MLPQPCRSVNIDCIVFHNVLKGTEAKVHLFSLPVPDASATQGFLIFA